MTADKSTDKTIKEKSFFRTAFFSLLVVSLLTTIVLTIFLTINHINTSIDMAAGYNRKLLSQTNYTIDQMNGNIDRLTQTLFGNQDIISFLYGRDTHSLNAIQASKTIDRQLITIPFVESVYLYNASLDIYFSSQTGELLRSEDFGNTAIKKLITDTEFMNTCDGTPVPYTEENTPVASYLSYFIFDINTLPNNRKNAIIVNVSPDFLTNSIISMNRLQSAYDSNFVVMNQQGEVISSVLTSALEQNPELFHSLYQKLEANRTSELFVRIGRKKYLESVTVANENSWYLISLVPDHIIFRDIIFSSLFGMGIMIAVLLLCLVVSLYFAGRLNRPIRAMADIMNGDETASSGEGLQNTAEFRLMISAFQSIQEQNQQLKRTRQETAETIRQEYLNTLITGNSVDSLEQASVKLKDMGLGYLSGNPLCMIMLKIDNYCRFRSENNPNELWILRFAITNMLEEISGHYFTGNVLSRDNDKFIVLIECESTGAYKQLSEKLEKMIEEMQQNVRQYMDLTLTAAYSTLFRGLDHLSSMAGNMEESLHLKMKYGHNSIISPHMVDESEAGIYHFPDSKVKLLLAQLNEGKYSQSCKVLHEITSQLFRYDYDEILSGTIHLLYSIYLGIQKKYPELKEEFTDLLKDSLSGLQDVEITQDIDQLLDSFLLNLCSAVTSGHDGPIQDNAQTIAGLVQEIVARDYSSPALCLSFIAEEIGLTPNYLGKLFRTTMQCSISQYILDYRMEKVAYYLRSSSLSLNEILDKVGIEKTNYFYTQFKRHFGVSLMEYKTKPE